MLTILIGVRCTFTRLEETPGGLALAERKLRRSCALLSHRMQNSIEIGDYFHSH